MTQILTGQIAFWLRVALLPLGGAFFTYFGFQIYDPETGLISIHVDDAASVIAGLFSLGGWKAWHTFAATKGGAL